MHLQKMVSIFYKDYWKKLIVISTLLNYTLPMPKPIAKPLGKWKQEYQAKSAIKDTKE